MLGELIRQLDTRRQQVLVEAIVVEIGDDAAKKLGVQFLLGGKNIPFVATSYSNASPNILTLGGAYAATKLTEDKTTVDGETVVTQTRSEEHTSELQSLMRISYAVFCLKKKKKSTHHTHTKQFYKKK